MPLLYFIQQGNQGPIKIGVSTNPQNRLRQLQTASPYDLKLIHVSPNPHWATQEAATHEFFDHLRMAGEWFVPAKELIKYIGYLRDEDRNWEYANG